METKKLYCNSLTNEQIDGFMLYKLFDKSGKLIVEGFVDEIKDYVHIMYHTYNTKILIKWAGPSFVVY